MHVVLFPSWYFTSTNPVRGNFFRNEAMALKRAGHQVGMIVPPSKFRTWHGLREFLQYWRVPNTQVMVCDDDGLATYRIPWWGWLPSVYPPARGELALKVFDRYCSEQARPDILHGQSILYGGFIASFIGRSRNIPVVLTEYASHYLSNHFLPGQKHIIRQTLRRVDKRFVIAPSLDTALRPYAPDQEIEILGCSVDTEFFTLSADAVPRAPFVFIMIASLSPRKAHDVLLKAFARSFRGQDVILRLAGPGYKGKKLEKLKHLIAELGIEAQVEILGTIPQEELLRFIHHSHALVSSSHVETFAVNVIEALACGKPVVATCSGGPEYFVNEENGLLVPTGSPDEFASAMRQLVDTYDRYDSQRIRSHIAARFSESAIAHRLTAAYENLLTNYAPE